MTIEELLTYGKKYIHSDLSKMLLGEIIKKNPLELFNILNEEVSSEQESKYKEAIQAIYNGKPIQYVLGNVNFYGNKFYINENVLIPRFETEELIEKTIELSKKLFDYPIDILDLGCGSGVIGITLEKKLSTDRVDLVDISKSALEVSKINKERLDSKANLIESNMLENINNKYDIIISNPPYIRENEEIEKIVQENEPGIALYGGEDGLKYYRQILKDAEKFLKARSLIALEIGQDQANSIKEIAIKYLDFIPKIIVEKDMSNRDRFVFIIKDE